jgi:hypothetical protein
MNNIQFYFIEFINKAIALFSSVLRPHAGRFWTTKVTKQTKENLCKMCLFMKISFNCNVNAEIL